MTRLFRASLSIALAVAIVLPAAAAELPGIKVSDTNSVPACATPGRLMAYLRQRNPGIDDRFDGVATQYMRYGEEMGVRWDMAFFQMILETGALSYKGDVRADQNNFAGLGAAGRGKHGERFADISSGVKAHLQHLLMYAGDHVDDPVAERTRKVQEWGVLTDWQKSINRPMTFTLLAEQWAPGSRSYVRDIVTISEGFYDNICNAPDPRPALVQEARMGREPKPETQVAAAAPDTVVAIEPVKDANQVSGAKIAEKSIEQARKEDPPLTGLGAAGMLGSAAGAANTVAEPQIDSAAKTPPAVTLLNPTKTEPVASETATETAKPAANPAASTDRAPGAEIQTASVAGAATQMKLPDPSKTSAKCKVWTASYGGQRAILIKAKGEGMVNYTVLDVNEASEKREVDAYIAAYAKGGESVGAFTSQSKALDKAFELCPEG
jgi:hypothetical protein